MAASLILRVIGYPIHDDWLEISGGKVILFMDLNVVIGSAAGGLWVSHPAEKKMPSINYVVIASLKVFRGKEYKTSLPIIPPITE